MVGTTENSHTVDAAKPSDYSGDFHCLWRSTIRNEIVGSAISVLPAILFYNGAFSYTAAQFKILLRLTPLPVAAFLTVDLALNWRRARFRFSFAIFAILHASARPAARGWW